MRLHVEKLNSRLEYAIENKNGVESENHWTATTWLLFFEDLHCRTIFDSSGNSKNERPDIQIWMPKSTSTTCDIWFEAKPPTEFSSKIKRSKAHFEAFEKLLNIVRANQQLPKFVIISDFETSYLWNIRSFKNLMSSTPRQSNFFEDLGDPVAVFQAFKKKKFATDLSSNWANWLKSARENNTVNLPLNLDALVTELLGISNEFRKSYINKCSAHIANDKRTAKIFEAWMSAGGKITVETIDPEIKDKNVGAEEAFSELCFHSVMVRLFSLKWFLDHGHLDGSKTAVLWATSDEKSETDFWKHLIAPSAGTPAETVLSNLLKGSEVYLWIVPALPAHIWNRMKIAFSRYNLVAEKSDILGEFYQQYLQKYAKASQKMLGQFYTPHVLTHAMWKLAGEIMRQKDVSLADKSCLVIDPCVGTGTFLTQGIRLLLDGGWGGTKKIYKGKELNKILSRFSGFELNPLSRGVALVNTLTEALAHSSDSCATLAPELRIFETNAYDIPDPKQQAMLLNNETREKDSAFDAWRNEILEAGKAKAQNQYRIVIGNPPWKNPSPACKNDRIMKMLKDDVMPWAWEYKGEKLSSIKGCNHGVREDYIFFFGLGMRLLQERGLLVYVTNDSWLVNPTYTMFRRNLLDNFDVHTVIKVGAYFKGVKENAAVVAFEKSNALSVGRKQQIRYLDWSEDGLANWSRELVDTKLRQFIVGDTKKSEFQTISAVGKNCVIRPTATSEFDNEAPGLEPIEDLFKNVAAGAQSGCGPLFLGHSKAIIESRIRKLFSGKISELAEELADEIRGGRNKKGEAVVAERLIRGVYDKILSGKVKYNKDSYREIWVHLKSTRGTSSTKKGICYFDPMLWLFPRVPRDVESNDHLWCQSPKIVFRDIYDPSDKLIMASVDSKGVVVDNHFFNGGVYVAQVVGNGEVSNLSEKGRALRSKFESDIQFLHYISAILNSPQVQKWSAVAKQERVLIPCDVDAKIARRCADVEADLKPIWQRTESGPLETTVSQLLNEMIERRAKNLIKKAGQLKKAARHKRNGKQAAN